MISCKTSRKFPDFLISCRKLINFVRESFSRTRAGARVLEKDSSDNFPDFLTPAKLFPDFLQETPLLLA